MIELLEKTDLLELFAAKKLDGIAHQSNSSGVMGAGLAKVIAQKYPAALKALQENYVLGTVSRCHTENGYIFNLTAQNLSNSLGKKTNYEALYLCLTDLDFQTNRIKQGFRLALPHMLGCGLGGGSWGIVSAMLSEVFEESETRLLICQKD